MYEIEFTPDARTFLGAAVDYLAAHPVLTTVISTVAHRLAADGATPEPGRPWWDDCESWMHRSRGDTARLQGHR